MEIGKVIGNVVSVSKIEELKPVRLFLIQILDSDLKLKNDFVVAIDTIGVGFGDDVIISIGGGSRFTEISKPTHTDASIIARIDNFKSINKKV
jgi:ethanolamine utilization protein EutN